MGKKSDRRREGKCKCQWGKGIRRKGSYVSQLRVGQIRNMLCKGVWQSACVGDSLPGFLCMCVCMLISECLHMYVRVYVYVCGCVWQHSYFNLVFEYSLSWLLLFLFSCLFAYALQQSPSKYPSSPSPPPFHSAMSTSVTPPLPPPPCPSHCQASENDLKSIYSFLSFLCKSFCDAAQQKV